MQSSFDANGYGIPLLGLCLGLFAHHGVFIRGEWHLQAPFIVLGHLAVLCILLVGTALSEARAIGIYPSDVLTISAAYLISLFSSIVIYRCAFHRLTRAGFPGPWYLRVTKLWHVWAARTSKNHLFLASLQAKYGDFVRTGPSEITVFDPSVFGVIDGTATQCIKAEWYDLLHPERSLVSTRAKSVHTARRKQWVRGFCPQAVEHYERSILKHVDQLERVIEGYAQAQKSCMMSDCLYWLGFDIMGDFVFSKSFGMLQKEQWHYLVAALQRAMALLGPFSPVPWLIQVGFNLLPRVSLIKDWFAMVTWCEKQMRERVQKEDEKLAIQDVSYYIMKEAKAGGPNSEEWKWMTGDSILAVVAGSEPTASALIGAFRELARYPEHANKIYDETSAVNLRDPKALSQCQHLEAVIKETLRLFPALLTGGNRKTSQDGVTIGQTYIPAETTIVAPRYSISRREDCFEYSRSFIPERWTTRSDLVRNKAAFTPFGTGSHSCLGQSLARDIMRLVIVRLIRRYHVQFPPGEDGESVTADMRDQFTSNPGSLRLMFVPRLAE